MLASQRDAAAALLFAGLTCATLAACGSQHASAPGGCATVVRGVVSGRGTLAARWLPPGFRHTHNASSTSALPSVTYTSHGRTGPRLELSVVLHHGPLRRVDTAGRSVVRSVVVGDRRALVGSGRPDPRFIGVYWKPAPGYLISVGGYEVPERAVLRVARHTRFASPITTSLPIDPGTVIARSAAVAAARRPAGGASRLARAKLTSWTEVAAMLTAHSGRDAPAAPGQLRATPWRPVWAVLLSRRAGQRSLVVVDATTGHAVAVLGDGRPGWYSALTDRAGGGCPGGSSARLPFGVLTRTEESYATGLDSTHWPRGVKGSTRIVLSTVPEVNRAAPGLYGGCVQQNCSVRQLVWVTITTERAVGRHRLSCLPPGVSVPAGYHSHKVRETFVVDVPDNDEIGCGPLPRRIGELKDLAPAGG